MNQSRHGDSHPSAPAILMLDIAINTQRCEPCVSMFGLGFLDPIAAQILVEYSFECVSYLQVVDWYRGTSKFGLEFHENHTKSYWEVTYTNCGNVHRK